MHSFLGELGWGGEQWDFSICKRERHWARGKREAAPNTGNGKTIKAAWGWGNRLMHNLAWLEPCLDLGIKGTEVLDGGCRHARHHPSPILKRGKWEREGTWLTQGASRLSFFLRSFITSSNPVGPPPVTQLLLIPSLGRAPFCPQQLLTPHFKVLFLKPPDSHGDCHHVGLSFLC